jgi:predicted lipoprotein with Yx(FWY)xxD motif
MMRNLCVPLCAALVLWTRPGAATEPSDPSLSYPGAVALSQTAAGAWIYKSFPQLLPLYVFKGEPPGRSLCDRDCTAVWPIVAAKEGDEPVGFWTIVKRDDGRLQWAYKNSPVYTYFEDRPNEPKGVGKSMDWYLDERANAYLASVGVELPPAPDGGRTERVRNPQATAELLQP